MTSFRPANMLLAMLLLGGCATTSPRTVHSDRTTSVAAAPTACMPRAPEKQPPYPITVPIDGTYDPNNIFAKIVRGEMPAAKVYEDEHVLAFMDLAPVERGHVLVISKISHARNQLDVEEDELARMLAAARRIGRAQIAALGADGFQIEQNNGYGQTVPQLHIHVIPRYHMGCWLSGSGPKLTIEQREAVAAEIRAALARL